MTLYHISIFVNVPMRQDTQSHTFIIDSDKTPEELKNAIIEHNKKRRVNVRNVSVTEMKGVKPYKEESEQKP